MINFKSFPPRLSGRTKSALWKAANIVVIVGGVILLRGQPILIKQIRVAGLHSRCQPGPANVAKCILPAVSTLAAIMKPQMAGQDYTSNNRVNISTLASALSPPHQNGAEHRPAKLGVQLQSILKGVFKLLN